MKGLTKKMLAVTLVVALTVMGYVPVFAGTTKASPAVEKVYELVSNLPDVMNITIADKGKIEEATKAYDGLTETEKADFDKMDGTKSSQPMGRELESAQWKLYACEKVDNSTTLPDGTYTKDTVPALESSYSKGKSTSKRDKPWAIESLTVKDHKAYGKIKVESTSYTYIITNGEKYTVTGKAVGVAFFDNVPVDVNGETYVAGYSDAMENQIMFKISNSIEEKPAEAEKIPYKITANKTPMFKVVDAYEQKDGGQNYLYITLSGEGYHELFKGTYDEAVATGGDSSKWIVGKENPETGEWQFAVPITADDTYIQIQALSHSHKKDGWWWYPRYIKIDQKAKTLEAGDYREQFPLKVTNNAKMFKVESATLDWVGGPHSNSYRIGCLLKMGSGAFAKAYIGDKEAAAKADDKDIIKLGDGNVFEITVEKIIGRGKNAKIESIFGEKTKISFYSQKSGKWFERYFTFDKNGRTLLIEDVKAEVKVPELAPMAEVNQENDVTVREDGQIEFVKDKSKGLTAYIKNASPDQLVSVSVDGKTVNPENYTVTAGSIRIDLHSDYLNSLVEGEHILAAVVKDATGKETELTGKFFIGKEAQRPGEEENPVIGPENPNNDGKNGETDKPAAEKKAENTADKTGKTPKTGDEAPVEILVLIMGLAAMGIAMRKKSM